MVVDDVDKLIEDYSRIVGFLRAVDGEQELPTPIVKVSVNSIKDIQLYNGCLERDIWQTLVDIELKCGEHLEARDLVVFNIINSGFWKMSQAKDVFCLDKKAFFESISYEMFLACCIALKSSRYDYSYSSWLMSECSRSGTANYVFEVLARIDKEQPLFLAKLFTSSIEKFMSCVDYSESPALPVFICKSFMQKTPLNKTLFRRVTSLFKQEMSKQYKRDMFMH